MAHARGAPHYRRTLLDGPLARVWERQPYLDKETAASQQEALVVDGVAPAPHAFAAGIVSSATTRAGRPLRVQLSAAEVAAVSGAGVAALPGDEATLQIVSPRHGVRPSEGARTILPATLHRNTVDVVAELLASGRYRTLVAPLSTLKWITVALVDAGVSCGAFGLQAIGTNGYPVTRHARRWLEPLWRAPLFDNWSMSELRGYAHPCSGCGFGHWVGAPTWFELIEPRGVGPRGARATIGELVATMLLPHGERMPLIRYRTGDLMERGPPCARSGTRGLRFRGRTSTSIAGAVLSRDLLEVTEATPDVAMEPHPAEVLGLVRRCDIGVPKARVVDGRIEVELRWDPARYAERASEVRALLATACLRPTEIVLHPPGALDFTREARKL